MRLVFECEGQKIIERELIRFAGRTTDASPAFLAIADVMRAETKIQFDSQGGHASGGWRPLKPATLRAKAAHGQPSEILQRTRALMRSLTTKGDENEILRVTPLSLEWGSRLPYSGFHQTGTRHMPRRAPVAFTEGAKRDMVKVLQKWLTVGELS